jgi:hypothetical protein
LVRFCGFILPALKCAAERSLRLEEVRSMPKKDVEGKKDIKKGKEKDKG